jgi:hypothetical protein
MGRANLEKCLKAAVSPFIVLFEDKNVFFESGLVDVKTGRRRSLLRRYRS